ncbi:MAG: lipase family protein [Deltaproteobacteria bacterium]|nr:lipase family protein [Deltaproteobacteria bacterium]
MPSLIPYREFAPQYSTVKYSPKDALSFCLASRLAYEKLKNGRIDKKKINQEALHWGFEEIEAFEVVRGGDIDTQGFLAVGKQRMLAAFRGTESLPDWLTNLQTVRNPGPWENTKVHEGFQDAFHAAALRIGEIIGRTRSQHEVWLTGHSLGGALAVLLAATLLENGLAVTGLYTFGAPRVGDLDFATRLDKELEDGAHWRVVNEGDVVPHLPPEWGFSHAGHRKLLLRSGKVSASQSSWQRFKKDIWGWIGTAIGKLSIADPHRLDSKTGYLQRLAARV